METGLKRLWIRRKSKGQEGLHDSGVGSLRKSQSTDQTGLSPDNSPRSNPGRNLSLDHDTSQFSPTSTADTSTGHVPSYKAHPTFFGISRPQTSQSRPGTAGSDDLMNAVNRAADAVASSGSEYYHSADTHTHNHSGPKAPRYIDIFSLSNPRRAQSALDYNEDVAARNLDLARVALEGAHHRAVSSSSKYQEEVAIRNAHPNVTETSIPGSSSTVQQHGTTSSIGRAQEIPSRMGYHTQSTPRSDERPFSRQTHVHSSIGGGSHRQSDQSWGSQPQVHELASPQTKIGGTVMPQTPTRHTPILGGTIYGNSQTPPGSVPHQHLGSSEPRGHEALAPETMGKYQQSPTETTRAVSRQKTEHSPHTPNGSRFTEHSIRSHLTPKHSPSVKRAINLPNRMIMDLTGDDSDIFYSETNPESEPGDNQFPVPEHAKLDTLQRSQAPGFSAPVTGEASTQPGVGSNLTRPAASLLTTVSPSAVAEVAPSQPREDPVSEPSGASLPQKQLFSTSAFSPINTVVSVPPRASVFLETPIKSIIANVMEVRPEPREQKLQEDKDETSGAEYTRQTPLEAPSHQQPIGIPLAPPSTSLSHISREDDRSATVNTAIYANPNNADVYLSQTSRASEEPPSVQPYKHMTDENVHPINHPDQNRASGVITRDFASAPIKSSLTSVPEEAEVNGSQRPAHPGRPKPQGRYSADDVSNGARHANGQLQSNHLFYRSTFNESQFAQKQAEARAALIRLQQSLNEDFFIQPAPAPVVRPSKTGALKHAASYSDGQPASPSSIFAQIRNASPTPPTPTEKVGAGTTTNGRHTEKRLPPRPQEDQYRKGKQKAEAGLDGPGPSFMDDELARKPLPLPPPLHMNGHVLQRVQQYSSMPPSPGEISLSSFPIPASSPRHSIQPTPNSIEMGLQGRHTPNHSRSSSGAGRLLRRQSSSKSQTSSTSAFSIPYHMIPDRSSSIRDLLVMEDSEER